MVGAHTRRAAWVAIGLLWIGACGAGAPENAEERGDGGARQSSIASEDAGAARENAGRSGSAGTAARGESISPAPPLSGSPVGGTNDLAITFNPMYSAYDGVHVFRVPATVANMKAGAWSIDPPGAADLEFDDSTGNAMITTRRAGTFQVTAYAGTLRGVATLNVTGATSEAWAAGETRYLTGSRIELTDAGTASGNIEEDAACTNCHGRDAELLQVETTPQQIAGYSDDELLMIITEGRKPISAPFRTTTTAFLFGMFHTFSTDDEASARGLVAYLRSLSPAPQNSADIPGADPQVASDAGVAASPRADTVACGQANCLPIAGPGLSTPLGACCVDAFTSSCGALLRDACIRVPQPHATCESVDAGIVVLIGCCVQQRCGVIESSVGGECRDIETLREDDSGRGIQALLPPAATCD